MIAIRAMTKQDINAVAMIHGEVFKRQQASKKWITCNFMAYPRIIMYVAINQQKQIVGYIQWIQKSGFRKEAVVELEQIAVLPEMQGKKIGTVLIQSSLQSIKDYLVTQNAILRSIIITTRADNAAQRLYEKILNAKINALIKDLYSSDEVIMLAKL